MRTGKNCNDHLLEGILFGLEKSIGVVISDLSQKMDVLLVNVLKGPLDSGNIFLQARVCSILSKLEDCEMNNIPLLIEMCRNVCSFLQS